MHGHVAKAESTGSRHLKIRSLILVCRWQSSGDTYTPENEIGRPCYSHNGIAMNLFLSEDFLQMPLSEN